MSTYKGAGLVESLPGRKFRLTPLGMTAAGIGEVAAAKGVASDENRATDGESARPAVAVPWASALGGLNLVAVGTAAARSKPM